MTSSIDESNESRAKAADSKVAEAVQSPELKVQNDNFELQVIENQPEPELAREEAEEPAGSAQPKQKSPSILPAESYTFVSPPRMATGIATVFVFWVFFFNLVGLFNQIVIPWDLMALSGIAFAAAAISHLAWFGNAVRKLQTRTNQLMPDSQRSVRQSWLLALLPVSWFVLPLLVRWHDLLFTTTPVLNCLPWIVGASVLFWIGSIWKAIFQVSGLTSRVRLAKMRSQDPALDPKVVAALQEVTRYIFPLLAIPFSFFGFTLPYVWFWKKTIDNVERDKNIVPPKEPTSDKNRLIIRYRTFASTEKWMRQRFTANKSSTVKNGVIALISILVFGSIIAAVGVFLLQSNIDALIKYMHDHAATPGVHTATALYNGIVLKSLGSIASLALAAFAVIYLKQTTHYEFTSEGLCPFRWRNGTKVAGKLARWSQIEQVGLRRSEKKTQANDQEIEFKLSGAKPLRLKLNSIDSIDDREAVLQAIEKWAPHISRDAALVQALQPPVDHSYTELWLQALSAPPRRDRLNPLTENTTLAEGRYRVRRALGVGGQGAAYEAFDSNTGELVVLKEFLLPIYVDVSVRKEVLERFQGEARILKNLHHPQVVQLADYFVEDHRAYLVLEHIDGLSLRESVIRNGPLAEEQVRDLARQMCSILTYLHAQEPPVVHRDFTPENLILRNDGTLKLIDFNVARQVESTVTSSVVGKPAYLPPEQFRGTPVPQSDIYGMGATLAFLLTGKDPEPINVSHPRESKRSITANMDKLVARATAIEVRDRYQNCDDILEDLQYEIVEEKIEPGRPSPQAQPEAAHRPESADAPNLKFVPEDEPEDSLTLKESSAEANQDILVVDNETGPTSTDKNEQSASKSTNKPARKLFGPASAAMSALSWFSIAMIATLALVPQTIFLNDPNGQLHKLEQDAAIALSKDNKLQAIDLYDQCLKIDPNDAVAYAGKGEALFPPYQHRNAQSLDLALAAMTKAAQLDPENVYYSGECGQILVEEQRWAEAAAMIKQSLAGHVFAQPKFRVRVNLPTTTTPYSFSVGRMLPAAYLKDGNFKDALAALKTDPVSCDDLEIEQMIANEFAHDPKAAMSSINSDRYFSSEQRYQLSLHESALASTIYSLKTDSTTQNIQANNAFMDGIAYNAVREWDKSITALTRAIQLKPKESTYHGWLADDLLNQQKYELALAEANKALAPNWGNMQARSVHARALRFLKRYEEALADYKILEANNPSGEILLREAACLTALGRLDEANEVYQRIGDTDKDYMRAAALLRVFNLHNAHKDKEALNAIQPLFGDHSTFWWANQFPYYLRGSIEKSLGDAAAATEDFNTYKHSGYDVASPTLPLFMSGELRYPHSWGYDFTFLTDRD